MKYRLTDNDKYTFISGLGTTLESGLSLLESIQQIKNNGSKNLYKFCEIVSNELSEGGQISEVMKRGYGDFDTITITLIKEGEASGSLSEILNNLAENIKNEMEIKSKIKSSLAYPAFVFILFLGILFIIFAYVIPRIARVLSRLPMSLPTPTVIIIKISDFLSLYSLYIVVLVLVISIILYLLSQKYLRTIISLGSHLPFINQLTKDMDLNRFSRGFYLLLNSGISLEKCFEYIEDALSRRDSIYAVKDISKLVINGETLSSSLKKHPRIYPNIMVGIIESGETSGELKESMKKISQILSAKIDTRLKTITTLIEPVVLVFVAVIVGIIMLSIIAPIYQLIANISPK